MGEGIFLSEGPGAVDQIVVWDTAKRSWVVKQWAKMDRDIELGAYKLKTTNLVLKEGDSSTIYIRDAGDTTNKNLRVNWLEFAAGILSKTDGTVYLRGYSSATASIALQSNDGTSDQTVAKLIGGNIIIIRQPVTSKTAAYTATKDDFIILCDASGGAFTVTLPTAVGIPGKMFIIKKIDTSVNAVTVDGDGTETIDGAATYDLAAQYDSVTIVSDNANWHIVATV